METQDYKQVIFEGIEGLPIEKLEEIADFVLFVRKRAMQPRDFEEEAHRILLGLELEQVSQSEQAHLEKEFADYDSRYPRE